MGSVNISSEDFMDRLIDEEYTYVAVQDIDDDFLRDYSGLFENKADIEKGAIFSVDYSNRKLVRCW